MTRTQILAVLIITALVLTLVGCATIARWLNTPVGTDTDGNTVTNKDAINRTAEDIGQIHPILALSAGLVTATTTALAGWQTAKRKEGRKARDAAIQFIEALKHHPDIGPKVTAALKEQMKPLLAQAKLKTAQMDDMVDEALQRLA